ncbi:hypothetical protein PPACK8108_LOCUS13674 [Phakopsora pachyrhizi]|uniref:Uncharacterized protein n=1 Tax=Phakopsora pachyrhizi TaxID=170000 RepID=A0AAV0B662_PHAPC|nr:hypothetical protein PPACK8108_LOCUS13674 [Phakopsora pachyrhizi]
MKKWAGLRVSRNAFASNSNLISRAGSASPWQFAIRGGSGWKKGGEEWGEAQHGIFAIGAEERRGYVSYWGFVSETKNRRSGGEQYLIAIVGGHGWGKEGEEGGGLIGEDDEFVRKFEVSLRGLRPPEGVDQEQRGQQAEGSGWDGGDCPVGRRVEGLNGGDPEAEVEIPTAVKG